MSLTTLFSVLGGGAGATVLLGVVDRFRNRKYDKTKQGNSLLLDDATLEEIQKRAETTQSSNMMAVGAFWSGQFLELSKQFTKEQEASRLRWDRLKIRLHEHKDWDERVLRRLDGFDSNPDTPLGPPPSLDPDEPM